MKKTTITYGPSQYLRGELQTIASVELADVLLNWRQLSVEQAVQLRDYLIDEMNDGGMLAADSHLDGAEDMGRIRTEARRVAARIDAQLKPRELCLCGAPVAPGREDCGEHGW